MKFYLEAKTKSIEIKPGVMRYCNNEIIKCWGCGKNDGTHTVDIRSIKNPKDGGSHYPVCDRCAELTKKVWEENGLVLHKR